MRQDECDHSMMLAILPYSVVFVQLYCSSFFSRFQMLTATQEADPPRNLSNTIERMTSTLLSLASLI